MELKELQQHWDRFGSTDPLWAILTFSDRKDNRWAIEEFFHTGEELVSNLMGELADCGLRPRGRCLDFGCGVGRLTQALCNHFDSCDGVDIAPSMIELARRYNRHGERCRYHLNNAGDLRAFPDQAFDFVCSIIVLQHMEPQYSKRYMEEFVRVLKPGGIAVFQVPSAYIPAFQPPLPEGGHKASITLELEQLVTHPNQRVSINARVRNESNVVWAPFKKGGRVRLGNHWLTAGGGILQYDDGRAELPELRPSEEALVTLEVTAPQRPGKLLLEIDLVEEEITWFAQRGLVPGRIRVTNRPPLMRRFFRNWMADLRQTLQGKGISSPVMEMYCVPKDEVLSVLNATGAQVVHVARDGACGDSYESHHYFVSKRQGDSLEADHRPVPSSDK